MILSLCERQGIHLGKSGRCTLLYTLPACGSTVHDCNMCGDPEVRENLACSRYEEKVNIDVVEIGKG